jgi:6-phosphogluconolactonase
MNPVDHLYVVAQSGGIAAFDLFEDGSMRPLHGSPLPTGAGTFNIAASPDRKYVYIAPGLGLGMPISWKQSSRPHLATYRVLGNGMLDLVGQPLALPRKTTPVTMAFSRDGRHLYLGVGRGPAGFFGGAVAHFRVGSDGRPQPAGAPVSLGRWNDGAAQPILSPDGRSLYIASVIAKSIIRLDIGDDGSLSAPVERKISSGVFPITPAISNDGRFIYFANEQSQSITGFRIGAGNALTELEGSPYPTGKIPHNPVFSKDGRFVYFANTFSDTITGYEVKSDGNLVALAGSPFATPPGPAALARSTDGKWLYLVSSPVFRHGSKVIVSSYAIEADGALRPTGGGNATGLRFADGPSVLLLPAAAGGTRG